MFNFGNANHFAFYNSESFSRNIEYGYCFSLDRYKSDGAHMLHIPIASFPAICYNNSISFRGHLSQYVFGFNMSHSKIGFEF